jgi:hypothetical protein
MADNTGSQFLEKLNTLPEEVGVYFGSREIGKVFKDMTAEYGLTPNFLYDLVDVVFFGDFNFSLIEPAVKKENITVDKQNKLIVNFLGKIFLPVAPYLKLDVKGEIIKRGGKAEEYQSYGQALLDLIDDKNMEAMDDLMEIHRETYNVAEEENNSLELFTSSLKGILVDTDETALNMLNGAILYLLKSKPDFQNKLGKALMENQEILTEKGIMVDEKPQDGTTANWLKDFISENGSDNFNVVVLSKYLSTAKNVIGLKDEEKKMLRRLLKLYRNLIFFPDSMKDLPLEEWEIVPIDHITMEKPIPTASAKNQEKVETAKVELKKPVVKKTIETPIVSAPPVAVTAEPSDLEKLLSQYPPDSLAYKAIQEEIRKEKNRK